MRMRSLAALGALAALAAGCEYGPQHLDAFYAQRDHWQRHIDDVEARYGLMSRDASKREMQLAELEEERRAREEEEKAFREWFKTLTPEQRFEWAMKQEELKVERERQRGIWGDHRRVDIHLHREL